MTQTVDPRPQLHAAFDQASRIIAGVAPSQLGDPTPCADFDVRQLGLHLVGVARRVAAIGRGEAQEGDVDVTGVGSDGLAKAFDEARQDAFATWADGAILTRDVVLPWATLPGALVASVYMVELTVHGWDLAAATGQLETLDPDLAEASLPVATQVVPPAPRGGEIPFGPVIEVAAGAPAYDRLAGYLGRRPR